MYSKLCPKCTGLMRLDEDELSCIMCGKVLYLEYRKLRLDDNTRTDKANVGGDEAGGNIVDSSEELDIGRVWNRRTPKYYSTMVRPRGLFRN